MFILDCDDIAYGDTCEHSCYLCKGVDGRNCDRQTGVCNDGCFDYDIDRDWWKGPKCDIRIRECISWYL